MNTVFVMQTDLPQVIGLVSERCEVRTTLSIEVRRDPVLLGMLLRGLAILGMNPGTIGLDDLARLVRSPDVPGTLGILIEFLSSYRLAVDLVCGTHQKPPSIPPPRGSILGISWYSAGGENHSSPSGLIHG